MLKKFFMKVKKVIAQTFDRFKVQYRLNKAKNRLELLPDKVDIQELINSDKEYALQSILDRFLGVPEQVNIVSHQRNIDKLDLLNEASELINDYCDSNNLSTQNVSLAKIFEHIKSKYKGVTQNEKENKQEKEQENFSNDGE